jgi:hypothetical protein
MYQNMSHIYFTVSISHTYFQLCKLTASLLTYGNVSSADGDVI